MEIGSTNVNLRMQYVMINVNDHNSDTFALQCVFEFNM